MISCRGQWLKFTVFSKNSVRGRWMLAQRWCSKSRCCRSFLSDWHFKSRCSRRTPLQALPLQFVALQHSMINWAFGSSDASMRETITPSPTSRQLGPLCVYLWEWNCMKGVCVKLRIISTRGNLLLRSFKAVICKQWLTKWLAKTRNLGLWEYFNYTVYCFQTWKNLFDQIHPFTECCLFQNWQPAWISFNEFPQDDSCPLVWFSWAFYSNRKCKDLLKRSYKFKYDTLLRVKC